ncbi:hypothetical protein CR513_13999, partial [Mucuna pruriens]
MVLPPSKEAVTSFILHDLGVREGEYLRKICQALKKVVKKGPEWGMQSYGASSDYKSWLRCRLETTFFTFTDPRFKTIEDEEPNAWHGEGRFREREFEVIEREKGHKELEQDQALLGKEELTVALEDARSREGSAKDQIC